MRLQQSHCVVSEVIQYPSNVHNFLKHNAYNESDKKELTNITLGGILSDINYSWLCNGPRLEVLSTKNGVKIAAWTFGEVIKDFYTKVTCVVDLPNTNSRKPVLVVGLQSGGTIGMICIFDTQTCRVLRAIQVDKPVTSIHVINAGCESSLPGALRDLDGILAVGTEEGRIYIVDLCRQSYEDTLNLSNKQQIRDEIAPCYLIPLSLTDIPMLERHREQALKTGDHICIQLNEFCTENEFILKGPRGETRLRANIVEVKISALHYCQELGSLLVGFNFGAFQLYNLISVKLEYSSPAYEDCIPVTHFAFQEPSDDPRAFCYIWVMYSNIEHLPGFPLAVMYSLSYANKEYLEDYGYLYQELAACSIRFQTELKSLPSSNIQKSFGANCISLNAYTKGVQKCAGGITADVIEDHLALCSVVWCVFNAREEEIFMCLFDLNQWYKEQMPGSPNVEDNGSYMVFASLSELFHNSSTKSALLDVRIDPKSITQFSATQRLEEHYYPSALSFSLICTREDDLIRITTTGIQRHLLSLIRNAGPLSLIRPTEIFQQCIKLGLTPFNSDVSYTLETSLKLQREMILSVALEHQLNLFLCQCARDWSNGSQSIGGCTLEFLLNWAWQRTTSLKSTINELCASLFDYSGLRLDSNALRILNDCARQLTHLITLYEYILNRCAQFLMDLRCEEVEIQFNTLKMISTYIEVLQWLLNVGLLPECPIYMYPRSDECERISAPYPVESLVRFYKNRRQELLELQGILNVQENQSCGLLFIDNLINTECGGELLHNDWKNDGGTGLYPPPSLQALLRTYLIENVDIVYKHCIFIYVFLDLAMTLDQSRYTPIITHLIKFPAVFKLDASIIKITQAFWQLDHGDFSTAMAQLLDPLISNEVLQPWHHRIAVKALLAQGQHQHALLYHQVRKPPMTNVQDLLIAITVLIVNDLLKEAFHFQRQNRRVCNEKEILYHFIEACDKTNKLSQVIQLPLDEMEEYALIKYLKENQRDETDTFLVQYYLQRSCFREAFENNDKINDKSFEKQGLVGQIELNSRNSLIQRYKGSLPSVTQDILKYCSTQKSNFQRNHCNILERPNPMSVYVHTSNDKLKYKSSLMQASLETAKDTWSNINKKSVELPFISTPKKIEKQRSCLPVIVPALIEGVITEIDDEDEGPTPHKRQRLSPRQSIKDKKKISAKSLLCLTPIVKRKTVHPKKISAATVLDNHPGSPQSILKVRKLVKKSTSPVDRGNSTTPELLENDSDYHPFEDLTKETIKNSLFDLSDYEINTPKNKTMVSARKSFRKSKTPSVHFEDSRASISSEGSEIMEIDTEIQSTNKIDNRSEKIIPITLEEKTPKASTPHKRKLSDSIQSRRSYKDDSVLSDISDILDSSDADTSKSEVSKTHFPKISGRKSLTRKVLEQNTLSKILSSPRQTRLSNKINVLPENVVGVEITRTESTKSYIKETYVNKIEEISNKNVLETKNTYSTKTDPNTSSQIIKHDHNESYTKSSTKLIEFMEDSESDVSSIDPILAQGSDIDESFLIKYIKNKSSNHYNSLYDSISKKEFEETQEDIIQDILPEENEDIIELQSLDNKDATETTEEYVTLEESENYEDTSEKQIEVQENVVVTVEAMETQPFEITDDLTDEDVSFTIHSTMNVEIDPTKNLEIKDMEPENYIEPNFEEEVRNVLAEDLEYDEQMNRAEEEGMLDIQISEVAEQQEEIANSQKSEVIEIPEVEILQAAVDVEEEIISDQEESSEEEPQIISDDDDEDKSEATSSSNTSHEEQNIKISDSSNSSSESTEQEEVEENEEIEEENEESEEESSIEEKISNQNSDSGENLNKNIIEVHSSSEDDMLLHINEESEHEELHSSSVNVFEKNITASNIPDSMNNTEAQIDIQTMESEDIIPENDNSELKYDQIEEEKISEMNKIDDPIMETKQIIENVDISETQNANNTELITESQEINEEIVLDDVPQPIIEKDKKTGEPSTSKDPQVYEKPKRATRASSLAPEVPKESIRQTRGRSVDIEMMSTFKKKNENIISKIEEKTLEKSGPRTRKQSIHEEIIKETSLPEKDITTDTNLQIITTGETVKENKDTIKEIPKKRGRKPGQNITHTEEKQTTIPQEVSYEKTIDKETFEERERNETVKVIPKKRGRPSSVLKTQIIVEENPASLPGDTPEETLGKNIKEEASIPKKRDRKPSHQEIQEKETPIEENTTEIDVSVPLRIGRKPSPNIEIVVKETELDIPENTIETVDEVKKDVSMPLRRGRKPSQDIEIAVKEKELDISEDTTETVDEVKKEVSRPLRRGRKPSQEIEVSVKDKNISENITKTIVKEKKEVSTPTRRGRKPSVEVEDNSEVLTPARRITRRTSLQLVETIIEEREEISTPTKRVGRRRTSIQSEQDDTKPSTPTRRTRRNSVQSEDVNATLTPSRRGRKPSVQSEDIKLTPSRRTRASSVVSDDKSPMKSGSGSVNSKKEILEQYSATHRLTRRQKIMMTEKGLPMGNIDPLALLDKETFAGEPDMEEQHHKHYSPTSSVGTESSVGTRSSARIQSKRTTPDKAHSDTMSLPSTPIRKTRASSKLMESPIQKQDQVMDESEPSTSTGRVKRKTTAQASFAPVVKRQRRTLQESEGSAISELAVKLHRLEDTEIERLRHRSLSPSLLIKESETESPRRKLKKKGHPSVLAKTELSKIAEEGIIDESKNVSKNEEPAAKRIRPKRNLN